MKFLILFIIMSINIFAEEVAEDLLNKKSEVIGTEVKKPSNILVDKDGDTITVLDQEARKSLNEAKQVKPSNLYDDEKELENFKSDYEKNILSNDKIKYGEYVVVAGDQLKKISQKIYGTSKYWREIQLVNETRLRNTKITLGTKLRYIIHEKENNNDGQPGQDGNSKSGVNSK